MTRHLATIQKVTALTPIEGADKIELAHILGWQCVVKKGDFKEGDLCIYFEIDSFLPIKPVFEFLRSSSYKNTTWMGEGFRLKTQRFRGEISQGLALPAEETLLSGSFGFDILSVITQLRKDPDACVGMDITDFLGVRKYEMPETASNGGTMIGEISRIGVPHTDEARIQTQPELLEAFRGLEYYITTKIDGSSHSAAITEDGAFHATGHNYEYKNDGKSGFYNLINGMGLPEKMRKYVSENHIDTLTIQGEYAGEGIQKNKLQLKKPDWFVFTVIINGMRVGLKKMEEICHALGLHMVPVEEVGMDLPSVYPDQESLLARAGENRCHAYPGTPEGIVIRPTEPVFSPLVSGSLSMKIINNKYLLKQKD